MKDARQELEFVNRRFDRDAIAFNAIYADDGNIFFKWFNKSFRKPIFERFDIAFQEMGDLKGKSVIDVGCGSGIYLTNIAKKGAERALGVDFSAPMLAIASQKLQEISAQDHCKLKQANFLDEDFQEKFNFSIAMGVFDYLPDPVTFLKKLKAVTTEKVLASFPGPSSIRGPLRKLRYIMTSRGRVYYYTKQDIEKAVKAAGFSDYKLIPMDTGSGFVLSARP